MCAFGYVLMLCSFSITNILVAPALNAHETPTLYRGSNANSPKLDNVRPKDTVMDGDKVSTTAKGISTFDRILPAWKADRNQLKNIWVLPDEAELTVLELTAVNDNCSTGHWNIRLTVEMTLEEFKEKLSNLNEKCKKRPLTAEEEASFKPKPKDNKNKKGKWTIEDLLAALERRGFEDLLTHSARNNYVVSGSHIARYNSYPYVARRSNMFVELPHSELDARGFDGLE
ncbi:hypothetical protein IEO21_04276 [Rhodonia placenta]|uniref:Uncharacterized protein n=1 Tax=Rhodonia placenta TaxID=104341 RepID=A0A8H7P431_9APHY|nr:hypothetical protein IEO21_04276 [Postia placenta]